MDWVGQTCSALTLACLLAVSPIWKAQAQQAGERVTLRPSPGLTVIPLFDAPDGTKLADVPASRLAGEFQLLEVSGTGFFKLDVDGRKAWVDSYDVTVEQKATKCLNLAMDLTPDHRRTGLGRKCQ